MIVYFDCDEYYPYFIVVDVEKYKKYGQNLNRLNKLDITEKELKWINETNKELNKVTNFIETKIKEQARMKK